jgi:hypothetical protein
MFLNAAFMCAGSWKSGMKWVGDGRPPPRGNDIGMELPRPKALLPCGV